MPAVVVLRCCHSFVMQRGGKELEEAANKQKCRLTVRKIHSGNLCVYAHTYVATGDISQIVIPFLPSNIHYTARF